VHRISAGGVEMLYEVVGTGTKLLSQEKAGGHLDVIGPLGNGFFLPRTTNDERRTTILVAGGVGVAPLVALAENLAYSVERIADRKKRKTHVLIGAKTKSHILCEKDFKKIGCEIKVSTEDGSKGKKGLITDVLTDFLRITHDARRMTIYACGPHPMLKAVARISSLMDVPCQVSLEEKMACGVGVCLGCPAKMKAGGYKMVCKDGPVFDAKEIAW
jgi:dihydroorotate dehydrogenase electron transfer subunit